MLSLQLNPLNVPVAGAQSLLSCVVEEDRDDNHAVDVAGHVHHHLRRTGHQQEGTHRGADHHSTNDGRGSGFLCAESSSGGKIGKIPAVVEGRRFSLFNRIVILHCCVIVSPGLLRLVVVRVAPYFFVVVIVAVTTTAAAACCLTGLRWCFVVVGGGEWWLDRSRRRMRRTDRSTNNTAATATEEDTAVVGG